MIFEKIFYIISIFTCLIYSISIFIKYGKKTKLITILLQTVSATVLVLTYINNQEINMFIQTFIFIFGLLIPTIDYSIQYFDINIIETYYLIIADINYLFKKYDIAKNVYKKAIEVCNESYKAYKGLGYTYLKLNDLRNAFDAFASCVEIKKDDYKIYYQLGYIYEELNKKKEAITVLNSGLRIKPDYLPISNLLAVILCELEDYESALKVIKYNPSLNTAYLGLGQLYLIDKNLDEAERCLFRATNSSELYSKAYYSLAKLYSLKCEEDKVVSCLKLAIDNDSSFVEKALNEPIFSNIKDFIIGLNMLKEMTNQNINKENVDNTKDNINNSSNETDKDVPEE